MYKQWQLFLQDLGVEAEAVPELIAQAEAMGVEKPPV